jgi:hypothetical protein
MVLTTTLPDIRSVGRIEGERRARLRFRLACPVRLSRCGIRRFSDHWTEEVNCEGFSCRSEIGFAAGEILDCELTIGAGDWADSMADLVLKCQVEVMRCVRTTIEGNFSLACRVVDYTTGEPWNLAPAFDHSLLS